MWFPGLGNLPKTNNYDKTQLQGLQYNDTDIPPSVFIQSSRIPSKAILMEMTKLQLALVLPCILKAE